MWERPQTAAVIGNTIKAVIRRKEKRVIQKQMSNLFNMDNGFFRALSKLADLMILNILFIICCIPIFTIGASLTAMYYVTLKMAENEEGYIARGFWKSFKQNFKQATIIWLIMLVFGIVLVLDLLIMRSATGTAANVIRVLIIATTVVYMMVFTYVFPTLARFYNTTKTTLRNAFIMAIADFPRTIAMLLITIGSVIVTFLTQYTLWYGMLVWTLAGFSLVAFANSFFLKKIFAKYSPKDETAEAETNPDSWSVDDMPASEFDAKPSENEEMITDSTTDSTKTAEALPEYSGTDSADSATDENKAESKE